MPDPTQNDMFQHIVAGAVKHFLNNQLKANTEDESFKHRGANKALNKLIVKAYCKSKSEVEQPIIPFEDIFARYLRQELINYASKSMPSNFNLWMNGFKSAQGLLAVSCFILFTTGIILFSKGIISFPYFTGAFLIGGIFGMVAIDDVEKKVMDEKDRVEQEKADSVLATFLPSSSPSAHTSLSDTTEIIGSYVSPLQKKHHKNDDPSAPNTPVSSL